MSWVMFERVVALVALLAGGHRTLGTVFGSSKWDATNPHSRLACYHRQIDDVHDAVVAHNTLPCRSTLLLYNPRTRQSTIARVGDRGPRHAGIDLSKLVAHRLRHNGREDVVVIPLGPIGDEPRLVRASTPTPAAPTTAAEIRRQLQARAETARVPVLVEAMADTSITE